MSLKSCFHCHEKITIKELIEYDEKEFCCHGCKTVYQILKTNSLTDFYKIRDERELKTPKGDQSTYAYLDHPTFRDKYLGGVKEYSEFSFYIEGIHCSACLWLLEKLNEFGENVIDSRLDMGRSILLVRFKKGESLSLIAQLISRLGYVPRPLLEADSSHHFEQEENKRSLIRLAIAFTCAGNIMLYALSVYLGASEKFSYYFNFFSMLCSIPVVFYCSIPFYKASLSSIRTKIISVDVPITIVILLTFTLGVISLFTSLDLYYFDTISILVFLLLGSRYILLYTQKKALNTNSLINDFNYKVVKRIRGEKEEDVLASFIEKGDLIKVSRQEAFPVDGIVVEGESFVNNAIITGESYPVKIEKADEVFMGGVNLDQTILVRTTSTSQQSRMGKIFQSIEAGWGKEASVLRLVDQITKYFSFTVLLLASLVFIYFSLTQSTLTGLERSFTLLLITCPCALALSTPLTMILGLNTMFKHGIYIKSELSLEKAIKIKHIFFDKTGTLTDGEFKVTVDQSDPRPLDLIYSLEKNSQHPIAKSIVRQLQELEGISELTVTEFREIAGVGVSGKIEGLEYNIKSIANSDETVKNIALFQGNEKLLNLSLEDSLRGEAANTVAHLESMGFKNYLLSGDHKERVLAVAKKVGIKADNCYFEKSPEEKQNILSNTPLSLMIGDGVNDAAAMQSAYLGIAVGGSAQISLLASDLYFTNNEIQKIIKFFIGAKSIFNSVKRNLLLSLIYNIFGVYLAVTGQVSPIVAAVLMPVSSLSVLLLTILSNTRLRSLIK